MVVLIHSRWANTSTAANSMFGVLQSPTWDCAAIPATIGAPLLTVITPEPLSPGHNDAVGERPMNVVPPTRMTGPRQTATAPSGSGAVWLMLATTACWPTTAA